MSRTSNRQGRSTASDGGAKVASIVAVAGHDAGSLVALAASVAQGLAPGLVSAIAGAAREPDIDIETANEVEGAAPIGVAASIRGRSVVIGNAALFNKLDVSLDSLGDGPERLRRRGEQLLLLSIDGQVAGFFGFVATHD